MGLDDDVGKINGSLSTVRSKLSEILKNQELMKTNQKDIYESSVHSCFGDIVKYTLGIILLISAVKSCHGVNEVKQRLQPTYQIENVIGQEAPEEFYEINGQKFYSQIDGIPVDQLF